jgi:hypothetical protein
MPEQPLRWRFAAMLRGVRWDGPENKDLTSRRAELLSLKTGHYTTLRRFGLPFPPWGGGLALAGRSSFLLGFALGLCLGMELLSSVGHPASKDA